MKIVHEVRSSFKVLIVDRDMMSGDLLASALVRDRRFEASAIQSFDLLNALSGDGVHLVVIAAELKLKAGNGFDLARSVQLAHPAVCIVLLLNHSTHETVIRAFRSGARGVFSRQQSMSEFLDCVEHVRKGFIWAGCEETEWLLESIRNMPSPYFESTGGSVLLTARELEVVQHAAKGKTNKTIATDLSLSEHTVKNYLFRAFEKLGVSSRVELLFYLTMQGQVLIASRGNQVEHS